jgi:phosphate transport system protein
MGDLAELMLDRSIGCLLNGLPAEKVKVFEREEEVNDLQIEIDERVIAALALQNPVAADLRQLMMASKIGGELERVGDQAVNICQYGSPLLKDPPGELLQMLSPMADLVRRMLRSSLAAFASREVEEAQWVLNSDDQADQARDRIYYKLLRRMMEEPSAVPQGVALIIVSRCLERVADHSTNIAEEVIYAAQGREIRHHHEEKRREESPM